MATLSAETQAIVDRLRAEGDLVRNSGTNSIRSVKIQLDRFEKVFDTISLNIAEQTKILQMQAGIAAEVLESQKSKEQFEEIQPKKQEEPDRDSKEKSDKTNEAIDKMGDKIANTVSSLFTFKNLLLGSAGLFVGFNFLKGYIDESTGGGFTRFQTEIGTLFRETDWEKFRQDFTDISKTIGTLSVKLTELLGIIQGFIDNPWSLFSLGLGFGAGKFLAGKGLGSIFGRNRLPTVPGAAGAGGAGGGWLSRIAPWASRLFLPATVATAALTPSELGDGTLTGPAAERLAAQGITAPNPAIANANQEMYNGLLAEYNEQLNAEVDRYLSEAMEETARAEAERIANMTEEERQRLDELRAQNIENDRLAREQRLRDQAREYARQNPGLFNPETYLEQFQRAQRNAETNAALDARESLDSLIDSAGGLNQSLADPEKVRQYKELADYYDGLLIEMEKGAGGIEEARNAFENYDDVIRLMMYWNGLYQDAAGIKGVGVEFPNGYRTGSRGFENFGAGSFAILHGREAVVPFNTAAGQFLDQYFTDNWDFKAAKSNRIDSVMSSNPGSAIVINAPTVAPVNVSNVNGGSNASIVNVSGGGGSASFGSVIPYGLTGAFS